MPLPAAFGSTKMIAAADTRHSAPAKITTQNQVTGTQEWP